MTRQAEFGDRVRVTATGDDGEVVGVGTDHGRGVRVVDIELGDGSVVTVPADEVESFGPWEIPLGKSEHSPWRIGPAVQGSGLALLVDRGIPCESHTHVLTKHTTNPHSWRTVKKIAAGLADTHEEQIDAFVALMHSVPYGRPGAEAFKDGVGLLFMNFLLAGVASECEKEPV